MQLALFYSQNAETFFHILEHLVARKIEATGVDIDAFSNSRYLGLIIYRQQVSYAQILSKTARYKLTVMDRDREMTDLLREYEADKTNLRLHAKYKALFGLSFDEMLAFQTKLIRKMDLTDESLQDWLKRFSALDKTADISHFDLITTPVPSKYCDPALHLKNGVHWHQGAFAFVKRCEGYTDAKSTIHLLQNLEAEDKLHHLKYVGVIQGYLVMLGEARAKSRVETAMVALLKPQKLSLLPPFGRKTRGYLVREADLRLAFR